MRITRANQLSQLLLEYPQGIEHSTETEIDHLEPSLLEELGHLFNPSIGQLSSISFHHPDPDTILTGCYPWIEGKIVKNKENNQLLLEYSIDNERQYHAIDSTKCYLEEPIARRFTVPRMLKQKFVQATELFELNYSEMIEKYSFLHHNEEIVSIQNPHIFNYKEDNYNNIGFFSFDLVSSYEHLQNVQQTLAKLTDK